MSQPNMPNAGRKLAVPTPPQGLPIASFETYVDAQEAVDHLSDKTFPVQFVTIVGADLKMVERVTGRLTYGRVTLAGLAAGAWFGLFVGILLYMFGGSNLGPGVLAAIALGAGFGALFSLISYAFTGGKRDFTSSSQIVASAYTILCAPEQAGAARGILRESGMDRQFTPPSSGVGVAPIGGAGGSAGAGAGAGAGVGTGAGAEAPRGRFGQGAPGPEGDRGAATGTPDATAGAQATTSRSSAPDAMYVTPDGRPRYGVRTDPDPVPGSAPSAQETSEADETAADGDKAR